MPIDRNQVIIVDHHDTVLGSCEKMRAHQEGLCHRAFSIFLYRIHNKKVEILLQKRHPSKYHSGGLWTNSCCGHPTPGEDTTAAANRRLQEELGIALELEPVESFLYRATLPNQLIEHEYDHIYHAEVTEQILQPHPEEIIDIAWHTPTEINTAYNDTPEQFTAWFADAWTRYQTLI